MSTYFNNIVDGKRLVPQAVEKEEMLVGPHKDNYTQWTLDQLKQDYCYLTVTFKTWLPQGLFNPKIRIQASVPTYCRLNESNLCEALAMIPDVSLISSISVIDDVHPAQEMVRRQLDCGTVTIPFELTDRNITLYRIDKMVTVKESIANCYSRIMATEFPEVFELFKQWSEYQPFMLFPDLDSIEEALFSGPPLIGDPLTSWALLGEKLLIHPIKEGLLSAQANPVMGCLWGVCLAKILNSVQFEVRTESIAQLFRTCDFLTGGLKSSAERELSEAEESAEYESLCASIRQMIDAI